MINCVLHITETRAYLPRGTTTLLGSADVWYAPNAKIPPKVSPITMEIVLPATVYLIDIHVSILKSTVYIFEL